MLKTRKCDRMAEIDKLEDGGDCYDGNDGCC